MKNNAKKFFLVKFIALIFAISILVFPRAYGNEKLVLLLTLLLLLFMNSIIIKDFTYSKNIFKFFIIYIFINIFALLVGSIRGNSPVALQDGFRLGVVFPLVFAFLWSYLGQFQYAKFITTVVTISGFLVSSILFASIAQELYGIQLFSLEFIKENILIVGVHDGYVQILAHSVGSLFFIYGYLLYYIIGKNENIKTKWQIIVLILVVFAALASGRRALLLTILLSPLFLYITSKIYRNPLRFGGKGVIYISVFFLSIMFVVFFLFYMNYFNFDEFMERITGIFEDDGGARSSQSIALWSGFLDYPIFGSGIGGVTDVLRSEESPWVNELTYNQMLFNYGLIGFTSILILLIWELQKIRIYGAVIEEPYGLVNRAMFCGISFFIFGAATNPYFGSFDFLILLGIIPFVATSNKNTRLEGIKMPNKVTLSSIN